MLNTNLDALYHYGHSWNIEFAPSKTSSLIVSIKSNISEHPPMTCISEVSSNDVLGFTLLLHGKIIIIVKVRMCQLREAITWPIILML